MQEQQSDSKESNSVSSLDLEKLVLGSALIALFFLFLAKAFSLGLNFLFWSFSFQF
jgi:hypothetical protein